MSKIDNNIQYRVISVEYDEQKDRYYIEVKNRFVVVRWYRRILNWMIPLYYWCGLGDFQHDTIQAQRNLGTEYLKRLTISSFKSKQRYYLKNRFSWSIPSTALICEVITE